jgi:predicted AAA+ superfamily ATPase
MYIDSIISKVVYEDIPKVFPVEYGDVLKGLLRVVASNPGLLTDYETLAGELGISRKTLSNYVAYLEKAFLLQKCYNFSRNLLTSEKKLKRLYLTSTTFLFSLADPLEMGKAVENLVVNSTQAKFFWRDVRHEVDAILVEGERIIPVESKYRNNISRKDIKGLLKFMERFRLSEGYVITETMEREEKIGDKKIIYIPLWKWLLGG